MCIYIKTTTQSFLNLAMAFSGNLLKFSQNSLENFLKLVLSS